MELIVSDHFFPLLSAKDLYLVLCGGAGSGKSEFVARKILYRCETEGDHLYLILRKIRATLKTSCIPLMRSVLDGAGIRYDFNKTDYEITFKNKKGRTNRILFMGLDDREKIKSIKGLTSIWMEEATQFTREDFIQVDLRLREPTKHYKQIILSFNPIESAAKWLKEDFFKNPMAGARVDNSTIDDNPIRNVREEYRKKLDAIKDPTYHKIYRLGLWAVPKGIIYDWDTQEMPAGLVPDDVIYGIDFGYSVDPAVLVKIYRKADEYWIEELIYERGLTNPKFADKIKAVDNVAGAGEAIIYADSSEPKSIDELVERGLLVKPAIKGPDSVRFGIDLLKGKKIHVLPSANFTIDEVSGYKWKEDKNGETLPEPVEYNDHAMDAIRYAIYSDAKEGGSNFESFIF